MCGSVLSFASASHNCKVHSDCSAKQIIAQEEKQTPVACTIDLPYFELEVAINI